MADLLEQSQEWLTTMNRTRRSRQVVYARGAQTKEVPALVGETIFKMDNGYGLFERVEARDYLIEVTDLAEFGEPARGDRVKDVLNGKVELFEVMAPGGEPHLAWPLIQEVVAYVNDLAKKRGVGKRFHVTTNGILLDDAKVRFLDENGFSLIMSLDGPEDLHNRLRPAKDSSVNSQQQDTLAAVRRLKGTNLSRRTTLRSTYTGLGLARRSQDGEGGANLVQRLEFLNALVEEGCASHVSVESCSLNETACLRLPDGHPLSITPARYDALTKEYHAAAEWYVAQVRAGKKPAFHHILMPLQRILYTLHAASECGAGCGYMAVDPSGNLYGYHRESKSLIGHLDTGVDEELRAKWKDNRLYARPDCVACSIKYVCGGGCRLDSLERHDDIHKPDPVGCFFRRRMFEEALWVLCELGPDVMQNIIRNPRENRRPQPGRRFTRPVQGAVRVARA